MSFVINSVKSFITGNNFFGTGGNKKECPLPDDLVLEVFSRMHLSTLGTSCCVSKRWNQLANAASPESHALWRTAIYKDIAFGSDKWAQYFGKEALKDEDRKKEFESLPWEDFIADCKKFSSIFPNTKASDRLVLVWIPSTLNGQLSVDTLLKLAKKYFSNEEMPWGYDQDHGDLNQVDPINTSYWVIMTDKLLPESTNTGYNDQQKNLTKLAQHALSAYKMPKVVEAAVCIVSKYLNVKACRPNVKVRRLGDNYTFNLRYTFCCDVVRNVAMPRCRIVGDFSFQNGLRNEEVVQVSSRSTNNGLAPLRRYDGTSVPVKKSLLG